MPKNIGRNAVSLALLAPAVVLLLSALPASAQIQGYGKDATGGAGGSVCTVTNSAASGTGSFSSCLSSGNRTIQFAVASATVTSTLYVRANTTIDGCANGQNGVTMDLSAGTNGSVIIEGPVSNIVIRCLRFQGPGGTEEGSDLLGFDGTGGQISRVAIERSTFVGAADGALDITGDVSDVTVQKSLFYGTILTQLIKYDTRMRISLHHNVYTAGGERNPQIKGDATAFDFVSNVVHANTLSTDAYGTRLWNGNSSSDSPGNIQINMVANAFMGTNGNIIIQTDSGASASGIYIASNNYCSPASNCPSSPASSPFTVPAAYAVTPTLPGCMATAMLPGVGSPTRTSTDTQKINAVASALPTNCTGGTPSLSIGDVSLAEGNSGTTIATFTATLSAAASSAVTVNYATANGTATAGSDYVAASGTLTFAAGTTTRTIPVTVNGDVLAESNETYLVNLSAPSGATLLDSQAVGTITNDDSLPQISIGDISLSEGNSGTKAATFTVTLSAASTSAVSVTYATANGTATAPTDYAAVGGSVTFPAGTTSQTFNVTVNGDTTVEPNETFLVNLSGASGATILDAQGVGTITNDDSTLPTLSINDVSVTEGNSGTKALTFTATLSTSASGTVTVGYSTVNGPATAGSDYVAGTGTLTFTAGQTTRTLAVVINGDTTVEPTETFTVNLSSPSGATILDGQGVGTIINDDSVALPALSIGDVSVTEGNSGTATATFTATLSAVAGTTVTVGYSTANASATAGTDYVSQTGTLTFTAGQITKTIAVTVNGDTAFEANETFTVNLASPSGASILDAQGVGTIVNDDAPPPSPGEAVVWTSMVGVSASGGSLTKTAGTVWGNAGAISSKVLPTGDGYVEFTVMETTTHRILGLSNGNTDSNWNDIDLGVYLGASGPVQVYEKGVLKGNFGNYASGDKLRVSVESGVVKYRKNGTVFYTSAAAPTYPLLVDSSLYTLGATFGNAVVSGGWAASTLPPPGQAVVWTSMVGVSASGGSLTKTVVTGWGNAGAISSKVLPSGDGHVEFSVTETTTHRILGLSKGNTDSNWNDIDFGLYLFAGGQLKVYEKGVLKGNFGNYASGDKLRVSVESGVVKYRKNGTVVYTSAATPSYPLLVDSSLYTLGATFTSTVLSGSWQ